MSAICEICGKEFKTPQGLRGHKTFVHQISATHDPRAQLANEQELSVVNEVVKQLVTLLKQIVDLVNKQSGISEDLIQYGRSINEQVIKISFQVSNVQAENQKLSQEITKRSNGLRQLNYNLKKLSRFVQYEFAGVEDDIVWGIYLDSPELRRYYKRK